MKIKEIRAKNEADLNKELAELRKELIKENAQVATGTQLKSPKRIKQIKKTVAKILTVLNEKNKTVRKVKKDE